MKLLFRLLCLLGTINLCYAGDITNQEKEEEQQRIIVQMFLEASPCAGTTTKKTNDDDSCDEGLCIFATLHALDELAKIAHKITSKL